MFMNGGSNDFRYSCVKIGVTVPIQLNRLQQNIKQIDLLEALDLFVLIKLKNSYFSDC